MNNNIVLNETFPVAPSTIYKAWLSSDGHTEMTGGRAECSSVENDEFMAWDGYITGQNKVLIENQKIVQSWRTTEFNEQDEDSELTIELKATEEGCLLTLTHSHIPNQESDYEKGWIEHYFQPMKEYFTK